MVPFVFHSSLWFWERDVTHHRTPSPVIHCHTSLTPLKSTTYSMDSSLSRSATEHCARFASGLSRMFSAERSFASHSRCRHLKTYCIEWVSYTRPDRVANQRYFTTSVRPLLNIVYSRYLSVMIGWRFSMHADMLLSADRCPLSQGDTQCRLCLIVYVRCVSEHQSADNRRLVLLLQLLGTRQTIVVRYVVSLKTVVDDDILLASSWGKQFRTAGAVWKKVRL